MKLDKIDISEIPNDFIFGSMTEYQKRTIEIKFALLNKYFELRNKYPNFTKEDIYTFISEDVGMASFKVKKIIWKLVKGKKKEQ